MLVNVSRREALGSMAGLVLGLSLPLPARASGVARSPVEGDGALNAFVAVAPDGVVTVRLPSSEMGQGIATAFAMIVAEELDVGMDVVRAEPAPAAEPYQRPMGAGIEMQVTGGSQSIVLWWPPLAEAGASARDMLVRAAAKAWGVDPAECTTSGGAVHHGEQTATYGSLAEAAARLSPRKVEPKAPADRHLVGTEVPRSDLHGKVTGQVVFGADVRLPGMRWACVAACPVFGGRVGRVDDAAARAVPGVLDVLVFDTWVAVVGVRWWAAKQGVAALKITWDEGPNAGLDSAALSAALHAGLDGKKAFTGRKEGNAGAALAAGKPVEAVYEAPYADHAPLEPMNCTVHVRPDAVEIWAPTQAQTLAVKAAADISGYPQSRITLHTTFLGGGFGRRGQVDYVEQAVHVAMKVDAPVQVLWTREEQFAHGFYRPSAAARLRGTVSDGRIAALHVRVAGDNVLHLWTPKILWGIPLLAAFPLEGLLEACPYAIRDLLVDHVNVPAPVPIGFWRSVSYCVNTFFLESFVDELAHGAGADPVAFRRAMLDEAPRYRAVLDRAVEAAGWGKAPPGRFQGVALGESFGSLVAEVAEISMDGDRPRVHKVTAAVDCGPVVNPAIVRAQIMGGVVFGLSAAFREAVTLENGRVKQSNFHDYPLLRMMDAPEVDVHLVENPDAPVGGIGEVAVPMVAPAVANAIFAATGKRLRKLPLLAALEDA